MNWDFLIDETAFASVLPDEYAYLGRPICDALGVFLEGLPQPRQAKILQEQATLRPSATVSERLGLLARSCPVLQKLGQILARDQRLAAELRQQLRQLESLPASVPLETVRDILAEELGPLDRLGVSLVPPALAEASVAIVIPFRENGSHREEARHGVFKVLKPGIEERLEQELGLLEKVGEYLDQRCDELQIPHLDYQESFQQIRDKLSYEVQLDQEQQHLGLARAAYADEPRVQIPSLFDHCTTRVTAMERVTGGKVTDHHLECDSERRRLAGLVVQAMIADPIFSAAPQALFHSDPHAGNLFLTTDQRLAILDWSLVGSLGQRERISIVQILLGALTLDAKRITCILEELSERQHVNRPALESVVRTWLRRIRQGQLPGLSWLIGMLDEAVQTAQLRVGGEMMLFRKSLHTIHGVVTEVGPEDFQMDFVLGGQFLRHFVTEWPQRWFSFPNSREFSTRLSNLDLTRAMFSYPSAVARFWAGRSLDLLGAGRQTA